MRGVVCTLLGLVAGSLTVVAWTHRRQHRVGMALWFVAVIALTSSVVLVVAA